MSDNAGQGGATAPAQDSEAERRELASLIAKLLLWDWLEERARDGGDDSRGAAEAAKAVVKNL